VDQIQPEVQWTALTLLLGAGGLFLTWLRSAAKWVGFKLFGDDKVEGWIPKLIGKHCEMMDAMKTVPESMKTLSIADEQQTLLLQQIVDNQHGHDAKLNAMIDVKTCVNQALMEYISKNEPEAMEHLRKAAGFLLKAKEN
jgi:hypothetical protein